MTTLKKLANMIRNNMTDSNVLTAVADALDAYIKARGEPVAWRVVYSGAEPFGNWSDGKPEQSSIDYFGPHNHAHIEYAYASPPPREPISQKVLMDALWARSSGLTRTDSRMEICIEPEKVIETLRALGIEITP